MLLPLTKILKIKKIALLSGSEAHHMSVQTKAQMDLQLANYLKPSWENTVERIFQIQ